MAFVFLLVGILCLYKIKLFKCEADGIGHRYIYDDYMSVNSTTSVKGIFIILIIFSHLYLSMNLDDSIFNVIYKKINYNIIDQSVVVMFLFYSGWALMYQKSQKGIEYIKSIPSKRLLKTFLHFDIFILIFLIIQLMLGEKYSVSKIVLSFVGWDNLGNQNWYIFVILLLYLFTYLAFILFGKNDKMSVIAVAVMTAVMVLILYYVKEKWWWDTAMCYPLGMAYYLVHNKVEALLNKKKIYYYIFLAAVFVCVVAFLGLYYYAGRNNFVIILKHMAFAIFVLLITMKIRIDNRILNFCGKNLFLLYMTHMLPIIVLQHFGLESKPLLFIIITWVCTIVLTVVFSYFLKIFDGIVFNNKKTD